MIKTLQLHVVPFIRALLTTCLFVLQLSGQDWEQQFKAFPTADINIQDQFGASLAISGDYLVVGAPLSDKLNRNAGAAYVYKKENGSWIEVAELIPSDPIENHYYGQSVAINDDIIVVGAPGLVFQVQGAAYVFVKSGSEWVDATESTKLLPNDPSDNNVFGASVAVGDSEVMVGDYRSEVAGEEVGAVYVFESADNWSSATQVAKLIQSDPSGLNSSDDNFGGNMVYAEETLVVGARLHDLGAFDDGALYVFEKPVNGWSDANEDAKLFPSVQDNNFEFGVSLAVEGDFIVAGGKRMVDDNDISVAAYVFQKGVSGWATGTETAALKTNLTDFPFFRGGRVAIKEDQIAVSAPGFLNDVNGVPGKILIYEKDPSATWSEQFETAHLGYDESVKGAQLGMSVLFDSEVSLLAGITDDDNSDDASGSVLVYLKPVSGWADANQNQRFSSTDLMSSGDSFGAFCGISGSYAVLGAPGDDHAGPSCGAAYIFENQNGNWVKVAKLTASDARRNDGFGNSVAIDGDIVVVGAPFVDELAADGSIVTNNMGAVYIFEKPAGGWQDATETNRLRISFPQVQERFGVSVTVEGDVVVGGAYNNSSSQSFGSVYVFTKQTSWTDVIQSAVLVTAANVQGDGFGNAVAIEQDVIAVGAVRTRLPIPGKVYIYQRGGDTWADMTETAVLSPSINTTSNFFGFVVDLDGGVLVAGDQSTETAGELSGAAYLYERPSGGWVNATEDAILSASDAASMDFFGTDVAISGNLVVIGAGGKNLNEGVAYLFEKPESGWTTATESLQLPVSGISEGSNFGISTAIDEDQIVVGAFNDFNELGPEAGAAFFFGKEKVLGVDDELIEKGVIKYFPNPVADELYVIVNNDAIGPVEARVSLSNLQGKNLQNHIIKGRLQLNLDKLPAGVYILRVVTRDGTISRNIIKN